MVESCTSGKEAPAAMKEVQMILSKLHGPVFRQVDNDNLIKAFGSALAALGSETWPGRQRAHQEEHHQCDEGPHREGQVWRGIY
eukprot:280432-Pyramimonas_sp.AAC.1